MSKQAIEAALKNLAQSATAASLGASEPHQQFFADVATFATAALDEFQAEAPTNPGIAVPS